MSWIFIAHRLDESDGGICDECGAPVLYPKDWPEIYKQWDKTIHGRDDQDTLRILCLHCHRDMPLRPVKEWSQPSRPEASADPAATSVSHPASDTGDTGSAASSRTPQ